MQKLRKEILESAPKRSRSAFQIFCSEARAKARPVQPAVTATSSNEHVRRVIGFCRQSAAGVGAARAESEEHVFRQGHDPAGALHESASTFQISTSCAEVFHWYSSLLFEEMAGYRQSDEYTDYKEKLKDAVSVRACLLLFDAYAL